MPRQGRPVSREWIHIVHGARDRGELVYAMDQGNIIRQADIDEAELTAGGVCFAASLHWLELRLSNLDFDGLAEGVSLPFVNRLPDSVFRDQVNRKIDADLWDGLVLSDGVGSRSRGSSGVKAITQTVMLGQRGLRVVSSVPFRILAAHLVIASRVAATSNKLFLLTIGARGRGTHAMALQNSGTSYHFFDPNFGHFQFGGKGRLEQFLEELFRLTYGRHMSVGRLSTLEWNRKPRHGVKELARRFGG